MSGWICLDDTNYWQLPQRWFTFPCISVGYHCLTHAVTDRELVLQDFWPGSSPAICTASEKAEAAAVSSLASVLVREGICVDGIVELIAGYNKIPVSSCKMGYLKNKSVHEQKWSMSSVSTVTAPSQEQTDCQHSSGQRKWERLAVSTAVLWLPEFQHQKEVLMNTVLQLRSLSRPLTRWKLTGTWHSA